MMHSTDLSSLAKILLRAARVIPMYEVWRGDTDPLAVAMRHDVDHHPEAWVNALALAEWEAARGYRSSYYFLHTAPYWGPGMRAGLRQIAALGHEIGFHNNALAWWLQTGSDPFETLQARLDELREWSQQPVLGTAAHGDRPLTAMGHRNYQLFEESRLTENVKPIVRTFTPRPLAEFGLVYQAEFLPRVWHLTDSAGSWGYYADEKRKIMLLEDVERLFPFEEQLTVLQHPDHWPAALFA